MRQVNSSHPLSAIHKNLIWEGRFQPIHRGHVAYIRKLVAMGQRVWIVVVNNELSLDPFCRVEPSIEEFSRKVDEHHVADKNPLPIWIRYRLVVATVYAEFSEDQVVVWPGHRIDLDWHYYKHALPSNRLFAVPSRDDFDDRKAKAWQVLGESVLRVPVDDLPSISATQVREAFRVGQRVEHLLCPATIAMIESEDLSSLF